MLSHSTAVNESECALQSLLCHICNFCCQRSLCQLLQKGRIHPTLIPLGFAYIVFQLLKETKFNLIKREWALSPDYLPFFFFFFFYQV